MILINKGILNRKTILKEENYPFRDKSRKKSKIKTTWICSTSKKKKEKEFNFPRIISDKSNPKKI